MRGRGLTRRCGMGICYRATRHWRSHQKIVSCLERFPRTPRFARSQILRLSSRSGGPIIPFFYRKFWFAATVVKTSFLDIRSSVISLEEARKKERSLSSGERWKRISRGKGLSREIVFFFLFLTSLLWARSIYFERCLFDNFSFFLFSNFYEFYSCLFSLSLSLGSLVSKSFVRVYYFLKLVDARYREVLSRDIPVSSCCKLMM